MAAISVSVRNKPLRVLAAILSASVIALLVVIILGCLVPVWTMILIYGRQSVQDAPAHCGIILFATIPVAGMIALAGLFPLAALLYEKLSPRDS
jgi:hypothetical protein